MLMKRVEEFYLDGKPFIYINLSGIKNNNDFVEALNAIMPEIAKYPENSLYTITDISDVRLDSESKHIFTECMKHNSRYVKFGAVIGVDGIKKIIVNSALKLSERTNMHFAFSKEKAIEWLTAQ